VKLAWPRSEWWAHGAIAAALVVALGVTQVAWLQPRERQRRALESEETRLRAEIADLQDGIQQMDAWMRMNPESGKGGASPPRAKHAAPAGTMTASLLESLAAISAAHGVRTELIQPAGIPVDEVVTDANGAGVTYRKAEIRLRLEAPFRDVGAYLADVESLDQLVVVRAVALRHEASLAPNLVADVTLWVYGTP
jgi:hypothetical protein